MFVEKYENLNSLDKELFKKVISMLLAKTFAVNRIYDPKQNSFKSSIEYRFIERNIELFRDYLELAGFKLIKDSNYEVIYIENEYGYNKKRLDKNTTIFLYGLRLKYDEEREKVRLNNDIVVTVADIVNTLNEAGAYTKRPNNNEIRVALSNLINFNIIQKVEGMLEKPETRIVILPSILFTITNEKITSISKSISSGLQDIEDEYEEENLEENGVEE